jgi:hypothetical protein
MLFIKEFDSVKSASLETNINESIISKSCRGDILNPSRYHFRYKNDEDNITNNWLIKENDSFIYKNEEYKLLKRNRISFICLINGEEKNFKINEYSWINTKERNNIEIVNSYLDNPIGFFSEYKNRYTKKYDIPILLLGEKLD